eukprot:15057328-Ditylum_brightwellii.AAC.1
MNNHFGAWRCQRCFVKIKAPKEPEGLVYSTRLQETWGCNLLGQQVDGFISVDGSFHSIALVNMMR